MSRRLDGLVIEVTDLGGARLKRRISQQLSPGR